MPSDRRKLITCCAVVSVLDIVENGRDGGVGSVRGTDRGRD